MRLQTSGEERDAAPQVERSSAEPVLVKLTEELIDIPDPLGASAVTDMIVIFYAAAGTVIGSMLASIAFLSLFPVPETGRPHWIGLLLVVVFLGGAVGCLLVALFLNLKGLVRFESRAARRVGEN
jgi:hypothetical protein